MSGQQCYNAGVETPDIFQTSHRDSEFRAGALVRQIFIQ